MRDHFPLVLDDNALSILNEILGNSIAQISTDGASIENNSIFSDYFAFPLDDDRWVNISSDWGDTPKSYLDYWCFDISISKYPKRLARLANNDKVLWRPTTHISLNQRIDKVTEILVHSYGDSNKVESVHCDRALTFVGHNGNTFSLITPLTIMGWMELVTEKTLQSNLLSLFQMRRKID